MIIWHRFSGFSHGSANITSHLHGNLAAHITTAADDSKRGRQRTESGGGKMNSKETVREAQIESLWELKGHSARQGYPYGTIQTQGPFAVLHFAKEIQRNKEEI